MVSLIIGEPGSGKSRMAEELALESGCPRVYYLATMLVMDEDGRARREKHRKQREGKGFITLEIPYRIDRALDMMDMPEECAVLLECLSNLVGNEMHEDPDRRDLWQQAGGAAFVNEIRDDIMTLARGVRHLIVVTNEFGADKEHDRETKEYIRLLSELNRELVPYAATVRRISKC